MLLQIRENKYYISDNEAYVIGYTRKGEKFIFDKEDFNMISKYTWFLSKRGYMTTNIKRRPVTMHKLLLGNLKKLDIDHISRDRVDNRRCNLRVCTHQQNIFNQSKRSTNTSGFMGVSQMLRTGKYEAYVHYNNRKHYFGTYDSAIEAAKARDVGAKELFGEYANLNFQTDKGMVYGTY